ncbi:DUF3560 domain-containing protein [Streptomyces capitiformicae]|uniref:DUF3560 domain-containing protein n=1 Tax=Streptomyces capitiformicae TaxID=2014920 RepID=A0A918Z3L4_9ACTN|nr:DUF3560 domain-containing protein [Streptomyces capitiformicae]GHE34863.1 hypothetical protein GCM10017771_52690 [Streptomyces capitiformicae]
MTDATSTPECRQHGPMTLRTGDQSPAQRFTGTWYACTELTCWSAVLFPSAELAADLEGQGRAAKAPLTITHTRAEGTLVSGSVAGDGVLELLQPFRFRASPSIGIYLRGSRDRRADLYRINQAADALRSAGHRVTVEIDETQRRAFSEAEEDRTERAAGRAEYFGARAERFQASSDAKWERGREITRGYAGEPVKADHYSAKRHMRDLERAHRLFGQSAEEQGEADRCAGRADTAEHYEQHRTNPGVTLRRLERLQADRRHVERQQARTVDAARAGEITLEALVEALVRLDADHADLCDEIGHWERIIKEAEAEGVKLWGPDDFKAGDFVRSGSRLLEVLRVNKKTVTVPGGPEAGPIVSQANRRYSFNGKLPYDKVTGRVSAEEMRALLAEGKAKPGGTAAESGQDQHDA